MRKGGHPGLFDFSSVRLYDTTELPHQSTKGVMEALNLTVSHFVRVRSEA